MPEFSIREARSSDRRQVAELAALTWRWGDYLMSVWRRWLNSPNGDLLVAEADGKIVGIMYVEYRPAGEAYLAGARVHPRWRRMGVATALTIECLERARSRGRNLATLATSVRNEAAQRLAQKLGFRLRAKLIRARAGPKAGAGELDVRPVEPHECQAVHRWLVERVGRPIKFDWYSYSTLTPEDVRTYAEEQFAFAVGRYEGVALWQPAADRQMMIMLDAIYGTASAVKQLGLAARRDAKGLGYQVVYGQVASSDETLRGLKAAGFRWPKTRGTLIYEKPL